MPAPPITMGGRRPPPAFAPSFLRTGAGRWRAAASSRVPPRPPAWPRGHGDAGVRVAARRAVRRRCDDVAPAPAPARKATVAMLPLLVAALLLGDPRLDSDGVAFPGKVALAATTSEAAPPLPRPSPSVPSARSLNAPGPSAGGSGRYWDAMAGDAAEVRLANERLIDRAVGTIATGYYDASGGFDFDPQEFYARWKRFRSAAAALARREGRGGEAPSPAGGLSTRDSAVAALKDLVASLHDPYSKYLTRKELRGELGDGQDGFLGLGALVELAPSSPPALLLDAGESGGAPSSTSKDFERLSRRSIHGGQAGPDLRRIDLARAAAVLRSRGPPRPRGDLLSVADAAHLPLVTAVIPDSPAERAGLVVGDRIAAVGQCRFMGRSSAQIARTLERRFRAENYFGRVELTVAKSITTRPAELLEERYVFDDDGWYRPRRGRADYEVARERVLGYKLSRVKSLATTLTARIDSAVAVPSAEAKVPAGAAPGRLAGVIGGDAVVHFALLTQDDSIFRRLADAGEGRPVGYIRLTRFSRSATEGYVRAVRSLEQAGAHSYIIDLRNNYGGVIQEAMVTAATLLRDPHDVLCYTLNSRGNFRPQEAMEYMVDPRYPGYLLSSEAPTVTRDQIRREHPEYLEEGGWSAPTPYASLNELRATRGIRPAITSPNDAHVGEESEYPSTSSTAEAVNVKKMADLMTQKSQKKLVILINEGTGES